MACFTRGLLQVHTRFVNAQIWWGCAAVKLPDKLTWDGCDVAFASMSPPNGTVEAC